MDIANFECSICSEILFEPVTTTCGHTFCKHCLIKWFQHQSQCPLCRETLNSSSTRLQVNVLISNLIDTNFPSQIASRRQEVSQQMQCLLSQKIEKQISIGNTHEILLFNREEAPVRHKWTFFVRVLGQSQCPHATRTLTSWYIEQVEIFLHPTFSPSHIILRNDPFEITRVGWGTFPITGRIFFASRFNKPPMAFQHSLSFERDGSATTLSVSFDKSQIHPM